MCSCSNSLNRTGCSNWIEPFYGTACPYWKVSTPVFPQMGCKILTVPSSALPAMQHLLTVLPAPGGLQPRQVAAVYVRANGSTTADCALAAPFLLSNGQLSSNGQIISTSGLVPHAPLAVSSFVSAISTTFSMTNGSSILNRTTLSWTNSAFTGGRALFCIMNSTVHGVYNGQLPAGCAQISIGLVPVSSCQTFRPSTSITQTAGNATIAGISGISGTTRTTSTASGTSSSLPTESVIGSIRGQNAIAYPIGCLESSVNSPAVSPALAPVEVGTLEECVDYCSIYPYFGVQSGMLWHAKLANLSNDV